MRSSVARDLTAAARQVLFGSPISRLGYAYAHALGLAWGAVLSTGEIREHDGLVVFTGMPRWAFRRGGMCVGGCYLTDENIGAEVLTHERVHQRQWRHYGLAFPLLNAAAGRDPLHNRFEIEAGLKEGGYL